MPNKAYWIAAIEVADAEKYQSYVAMVGGILAKYRGRFLVRGGACEVVEGSVRPRVVVIEFPDRATAEKCYRSPEYSAAKAIRNSASMGDVVIVEGYAAVQP